MDVWVGQIVADLSQVAGLDAKAESKTNKTCQAVFESILGMLIASDHQVQPASPSQVEQSDPQALPVCEDGSTIGFDFQKAQVVVSGDRNVAAGLADSTSGLDGTNPNAVADTPVAEMPASLLTLGSSLAQIRLSLTGKDQIHEITLPTQGLTTTGESSDTPVSRTDTFTCSLIAQDQPKNDPVGFDVLRFPNDFIGNQEQALAGRDWPGLVNNRENRVEVDGGDQAIKIFRLSGKPRIDPEEVSNPVLVNSMGKPWLLNRVAMLLDPETSGDWLVKLQSDAKTQFNFAIGKPIFKTEMLSDLLPGHPEMGSALDPKSKMASSVDLLPGGLLKEQAAVVHLEAPIDPVMEEIRPQIDSMESSSSTPGNSILQLAKQVFLRQQIGLEPLAYKAATVKAEVMDAQIQSSSSQVIESIATRAEGKSPINLSVSNRKPTNDSVAVLMDSLRGLLGAQDRVASVNGEPKAVAVCRQIFDRIVDQIPKSIGEGHQVSLRIGTDEGERIKVDISLISNQVRARISVADVELRDLLASHGWLLVQRFEANGLVAQGIEFSLLSERDMTDNRRAKKWVDEQSSVDDLEQVLNEFDVLEVKSIGFDRFA